ncbi:MAG: hypothetical protein NT062_02960 [Proteobacteria bacterium]|nr:hypothetical protein [Pseudomonadota bacterium]
MLGDQECTLLRLAAALPAVPGALDVYVDWLLTHDPLRGQLFQQRLHRQRTDGPFAGALSEGPKERDAWITALGLEAARCEELDFDPLPRRLTIDGAHLALLEPVLDALPFLHVHLVLASHTVASVFTCPVMAKVRSLSWRAQGYEANDDNDQSQITTYFGDRVVAALAASPNVTQLETLWLGGDAAGSTCAQLVAAVPFVALREFSIYEEPVGSDGAAALARAPLAATLRRLSLTRCAIGDAGALALASSSHFAQLEELHLVGNGISPVGAAALRASPHLQRLTVLSGLDLDGSRR